MQLETDELLSQNRFLHRIHRLQRVRCVRRIDARRDAMQLREWQDMDSRFGFVNRYERPLFKNWFIFP